MTTAARDHFVATAEAAGALGMISGLLNPAPAIGLMLLMLATMSLHIISLDALIHHLAD